MKTISTVFLLCVMAGAAMPAGGQAVEAARERKITLTAGAIASGFRPDYGTSYPLFGAGTYVDVRFTHWVQLEAEGRWMHWNEYYGQSQSNYLIGPRVPIVRFGNFHTYGKVLIGLGRMTFPEGDFFANGSFTALAYGGTLDYTLNHRWSVRVLDFEFQDWPKFIPENPYVANSPDRPMHPYGVSVGIGYRVF